MITFTLDGQEHSYDEAKLMNYEAIALKKNVRMSIAEFGAALGQADPEALTALVWMTLRREGSDIRYSDLEFDLMEMANSLVMPEEDTDDPDAAVEGGVEADSDPTTSTTKHEAT